MTKEAKEAKVNMRQSRFIDAYLGEANGNGTRAAIMAGYSEKTARIQAAQLLAQPNIRARIDAVLKAESLSAAEVLHRLTDIATAEWRDFIVVRTNPKTGETLDAKLVLGDQVKALELLGKYHRLFTERVETTQEVVILDYGPGAADNI